MIITRVATLYKNKVISLPPPYRHPHLIAVIKDMETFGKPPYVDQCQGFVTSEGMFVDRNDAAKLVVDYKQPLTGPLRCQLFSEEVWETLGDWRAEEGTAERTLYDTTYDIKTMRELVTIEEFTGSAFGYVSDVIISDIGFREGCLVYPSDYDILEKTSMVLYSQVYTEPAKDYTELKDRLAAYSKKHMINKSKFRIEGKL